MARGVDTDKSKKEIRARAGRRKYMKTDKIVSPVGGTLVQDDLELKSQTESCMR